MRVAIANFESIGRNQKKLMREVSALSNCFGINGSEARVDITTPRAAILKKSPKPIIRPSGTGWMHGATFDARPVAFGNRRLVYFCGQPVYRSDSHLFVGLGEWQDDTLSVDNTPVIVPDIESRGIDIPAFTVWQDKVLGLYLDDSGPLRSGVGHDTNAIVVQSADGRTFTKHRLALPASFRSWDRIGLPWLLALDDQLLCYWRAKKGERCAVVRSIISEGLDHIEVTGLDWMPRNPINLAVTYRDSAFLILYGMTIGGGFYCAPSADGEKFDYGKETMLISKDTNEWGWDYMKHCGSPDNTQADEIELCYLASPPYGLSVGHAKFSMSEFNEFLLQH